MSQEIAEVNITQDMLEKLVQLKLHEVPQDQIVAVTGLPTEVIDDLVEEPEYKRVYAERLQEYFQQQQDIADGWDGLERAAVQAAYNYMRTAHDPDYALKAAMAANRASRSHRAGNRIINPGQGTLHATITMNTQFVTNVQQHEKGLVIEHRRDREKPALKATNMMMPGEVAKFLKPIQQETDELLDGLSFAIA